MRMWRVVIALLVLLSAQHGALVHGVWHIHEEVSSPVSHAHDDTDTSPASELCSLHAILGQVLAAMHGLPGGLAAGAASHVLAGALPATTGHFEAVPAVSRGPPALL